MVVAVSVFSQADGIVEVLGRIGIDSKSDQIAQVFAGSDGFTRNPVAEFFGFSYSL